MSLPVFVLAPMDGMTHASFRTICFEYGADGATTEMIQSLALGRAKRRLSETFAETMVRFPNEGDLAAQLIGSDPAMMAAAAQRLEAMARFDAIDINMGCPARKVVGSGNGAALLREPERAFEIMRAVREAISMPVRLKLRLGWDAAHITAGELIIEAERLGFQSVTLHGRTRMQMYRGDVDVKAIRRICESTGIPVYANGGVTCAADALTFLDETRAAGVSIGRAALKQPWIFSDIRRLRRGDSLPSHGAEERIGLLIRLAGLSCAHRPERVAISEMRKFSRWLLPGLTGADDILGALNGIWDLDSYRRLLSGFLDALIRTGDTYLHEELGPDRSLDTVHR
ncbi:MAG: tRNA-dihydrouridine synthase [Clostridia bacterium]|nr:tRNA-dihydrouridine synthase [Clostridia bacterium]